ncbi:hypothetical protein FVE85_2357 [Porphyridium purpureum]|uniref:Uncharacterized protein n=1 Tax=Porphyridium purpureum TaxID=35688 RepID=A0A5J4YZD6_PORPP|nr:hypothetical protein FVE85_2357 [Porphyridium purpureum]|eukprot:POR2797..scf209_3
MEVMSRRSQTGPFQSQAYSSARMGALVPVLAVYLLCLSGVRSTEHGYNAQLDPERMTTQEVDAELVMLGQKLAQEMQAVGAFERGVEQITKELERQELKYDQQRKRLADLDAESASMRARLAVVTDEANAQQRLLEAKQGELEETKRTKQLLEDNWHALKLTDYLEKRAEQFGPVSRTLVTRAVQDALPFASGKVRTLRAYREQHPIAAKIVLATVSFGSAACIFTVLRLWHIYHGVITMAGVVLVLDAWGALATLVMLSLDVMLGVDPVWAMRLHHEQMFWVVVLGTLFFFLVALTTRVVYLASHLSISKFGELVVLIMVQRHFIITVLMGSLAPNETEQTQHARFLTLYALTTALFALFFYTRLEEVTGMKSPAELLAWVRINLRPILSALMFSRDSAKRLSSRAALRSDRAYRSLSKSRKHKHSGSDSDDSYHSDDNTSSVDASHDDELRNSSDSSD